MSAWNKVYKNDIQLYNLLPTSHPYSFARKTTAAVCRVEEEKVVECFEDGSKLEIKINYANFYKLAFVMLSF